MKAGPHSSSEDIKATAGNTLIYAKDGVASSLILHLARATKQAKLGSPCARGLTSLIYRVPEDDKEVSKAQDDRGAKGGGEKKQEYCFKRVLEEDEVAPHSVQREILCYQLIDKQRAQGHVGNVSIATLLAAFRDESDPFSVTIDLAMPFYRCNLEDVLDEPLIQFSASEEKDVEISTSPPQPALLIAEQIKSSTVESFVYSTARDLFSALAFLHSNQIAHRDIKPSNILIDYKTLSIVLIDFGTSHVPSFSPGDDGKGGMTSEVGTGPYRAPESLFCPLNGYSPDKVDIWQAGTTLAQFFLPLQKVQVKKPLVKKEKAHKPIEEDDRLDWEKALWADDAEQSWSQLDTEWKSDHSDQFFYHAQQAKEQEVAEETLSGWKRKTLFDSSRGDIGLASSIFQLKGLPESNVEWPEAEFFQPSLERMPFPRRPAAPKGLMSLLMNDNPSSMTSVVGVIDQCIQLSSSKRISADEAAQQVLLQLQTTN